MRRAFWLALILMAVGVAGAAWLLRPHRAEEPAEARLEPTRLFEQVMSHVRRHGVDSIPESDLYRRAASGLLTSLEDEYVKMAFELRRAGIAAELYLGAESRMGKQLKYADECGIPLAILYGSDEHKHAGGPVVTIKDLLAGQAASKSVSDRGEHLKITREKQSVVPRSSLVARVTELIGRQTS